MSDRTDEVAPLARGISSERHAAPRLYAFQALYGSVVVDSRGSVLGTFDELLLDLAKGRIAYGLVSSGGFMGRGERLHPVPWAALTRDTDRHRFVVACDKARFDASPTLERGRWPVPDLGWHLALHRHFQCRPYWQ